MIPHYNSDVSRSFVTHGRVLLAVLAALLLLSAWAVPAFAQTPCDATGEPLDAIQTRRQLKRLVQCAVAYVAAVGWTQATVDFQSSSVWLDGSTYLFAGDISGTSIRFVTGSDLAPGADLSDRRGSNGHYYILDIARVAREYGSGYVYYGNRNSGVEEPHLAYVTTLDVHGEQLYFGAGTYPLDAPGACPADRIRAALVATERDVEQFVNCAAEHLRRQGLAALAAFETESRWISGTTYLFLVDLETLVTVSNAGDPGLRGTYRGDTVHVREMQRILKDYGEGYVYYMRRNPVSGAVEPKASFVRRVSLDGRDYILGAGLYVAPRSTLVPADAPVSTDESVERGGYRFDDELAEITVEGSMLVYTGTINARSYELFLNVVAGKEDEITTFRIDSGGGDTEYGRKLGGWILDRGLDVVVQNLCFSSCANYVFTAGRNKTILADSIVGWHGSEQQDAIVTRALGLSMNEHFGQMYNESAASWGEAPSDVGRKEFINYMLARVERGVKEEREFLDRIGVSSDALLYGLLPARFDAYYLREDPAFADAVGWTFSIEDMAAFGIGNVTYEGDGEYPSDRAQQMYGVVVFTASN